MEVHPEHTTGRPRRRLDQDIADQWRKQKVVQLGSALQIRHSTALEFAAILEMLNDSDGIVRPYPEALHQAIGDDRSIVAVDMESGEIVAHQRYEIWPDLMMTELRTAFVRRPYRGQGLNTLMKQLLVDEIFARNPGWKILGFCKPTSLSRNIFLRIGFKALSLDDVLEKWPELSKECRTDDCYLINGHACGCAVSVLDEEYWKLEV